MVIDSSSLPSVGMSAAFTVGEVKWILRGFKEKTPGKSGVNRRCLLEVCNEGNDHTKVEQPASMDDYRPISLLEVPSSCCKLLYRRVSSEFEKHWVFGKNKLHKL